MGQKPVPRVSLARKVVVSDANDLQLELMAPSEESLRLAAYFALIGDTSNLWPARIT
ncbi:hypothetical protein D9M68_668410 [compost metagenome]